MFNLGQIAEIGEQAKAFISHAESQIAKLVEAVHELREEVKELRAYIVAREVESHKKPVEFSDTGKP